MYVKVAMCAFILCTLFSSCVNKGSESKIIQQARQTKIDIPVTRLLCLQPHNIMTQRRVTQHQDYRYVVYYDSLTCSICELQRMSMWNGIIDRTNEIGVGMEFLFIFAPGCGEKTDNFIKDYYQNKYNLTVFVDTVGCVLRQNPLLGNRIMHAFILDRNNNIVKIGDASRNKELEQKYYQYLYSIK